LTYVNSVSSLARDPLVGIVVGFVVWQALSVHNDFRNSRVSNVIRRLSVFYRLGYS